jgi:iron-sulfur cluster repair protein YtfE (RIC family)
MLQQDHDKVKQALSRILETTEGAEKTRAQLFEQVKKDLEIHTRFEEEVFYPTFREDKADAEAKAEVKDALNEHDEAKKMLATIASLDPTSPDFAQHIESLKNALEHHISDEEDEMFPQARQTVSDDEAVAMADRYQAMKKSMH